MPSRRTFFKALANSQEAMDDKVSSVVYLFNCVNNFENNFLFFSNSTALATSFPDALFTVYKQTGQSSHYLVLACVPLFSCLSVSAFYLCKLSPQWAYHILTCRACDVPVNSRDRVFPMAAARVWNSLLAGVTSSPSLSTFKRRLKTELFVRSYP